MIKLLRLIIFVLNLFSINVFAASTPSSTIQTNAILNKDYFKQMSNQDFLALSAKQKNAIACQFFVVDPKKAKEFYLSISPIIITDLNSQTPMCRSFSIINKIPEMQLLLNKLAIIQDEAIRYTACWGDGFNSMSTFSIVRTFLLTLAATDPYPDVSHDDFPGAPSAVNLLRWSQQGRWEKQQYTELQNTINKINSKLQAYYIAHFHVSKEQAKTATNYYINRIISTYTTDDTSNSTVYMSACLDLNDLNDYLKVHQPPKQCNDTLASPKEQLQRLLGLAIVNDYPMKAIKQLIADGANVNVKTDKYSGYTISDTPLMLAVSRPDVIALLLKVGANPNSQNWFGKTALMYAAQQNDAQSINLLLKAGALINQTTAAESKNYSEADDISCSGITAGSRTALMYAAWQGTPDIIKLLLSHHADLTLKDTKGQTAYDYLTKNVNLSQTDRQAMQASLKPVTM